MADRVISNPIINSPYDPPARRQLQIPETSGQQLHKTAEFLRLGLQTLSQPSSGSIRRLDVPTAGCWPACPVAWEGAGRPRPLPEPHRMSLRAPPSQDTGRPSLPRHMATG